MDIKIQTDNKNAPNWSIPTYEFSQDVYRSQTALLISPKVGILEDGQTFITLELSGLRYKHFNQFKVEIKEGSSLPFEEIYLFAGNLTGMEYVKELVIFPSSPEGAISLTDGFKTYDLKWKQDGEQIQVFMEKAQVIVHFEHGVMDDFPDMVVNQKMIEILTECKKKTTDPEALNGFDRQIAKLLKSGSFQ